MVTVILVSHGGMAKGMVESTTMEISRIWILSRLSRAKDRTI